MENLFNPTDRAAITQRLSTLQPSSPRQWGKMNPSQMLAHCAMIMEIACGDRPRKQIFIGRLLAPFVRKTALGEQPFRRNGPTGAEFKILDERDFAAEQTRLVNLVDRFCVRGPANAEGVVHPFFGRLTAEEWGRLMYKHLDHHLRQFSA